MKIRKLLISAAATVTIAAAVCSGCARMPSDYVPDKVFRYDDSQDSREILVVARDDIEPGADPDSYADVIISDDAAEMHQLSVAGSVTENGQTADETPDETLGEQVPDPGEYSDMEKW